jgi:hypothetical protein
MRALGMYVAIMNGERERVWADEDEWAGSLARAESRSTAGRAPEPRVRHLARILPRRLLAPLRRLLPGSATGLLLVAMAAPGSAASPDDHLEPGR